MFERFQRRAGYAGLVAALIGTRRVRAGWFVAAVGWLVVVGGGGTLIVQAQGPALAGVIGASLLTVAAMVPRRVALEVTREMLRLGGRERAIARVELAPWLFAGAGIAIGTVAILHGDRGRVRIGGLNHDGEGYPLAARGETSVDVEVRAAELDAILGELGFQRGPRGPALVLLARNPSTVGHALRFHVLPIMGFMSIVMAGGLALGGSGLGQQLGRTQAGQLAMGFVGVAVAIGFVVWQLLRFRRGQRPARELHCQDLGLVLARAGGRVLVRTGWSEVRAEPRKQQVRALSWMPVLVLHLGRKRLRLGVRDTRLLWRDRTATTLFEPTWLVSAAHWEQLVDALRTRGRLCVPVARRHR